MVIKTYFNKSNILVSDSELNHGLNPIAELFYGDNFSRYIFHFNLDRVKELTCNGTFSDKSKLKHVLRMTNTASINGVDKYENVLGKHDYDRATSFELMLFAVPQEWDEGKGYNYSRDIWLNANNQLSNQASTWFNAKTGVQWGQNIYEHHNFHYEDEHDDDIHDDDDDYNHIYHGISNGIYNEEFLTHQFDRYKNGKKSVIITTQKFDIGNENLEMDITNIINKMLSNEIIYKNYGFALAFVPYLENLKVKPRQYVGFFTENTSSFFEPYLETTYDEYVKDDRNNFYLNKENRLYFYSFIGGHLQNLNKLPKCQIIGEFEDGKELCVNMDVKQGGVGIYYVEAVFTTEDGMLQPNRMFYDRWYDLEFKTNDGTIINLEDVKLEFVTIDSNKYYNFNSYNVIPQKYSINIGGIKYGERLKRGEVRKIIADARIEYTTNQSDIMADMEYRIYTKNGGEELTIIDYRPMNRTTYHNYFLIDTLSFLPQKYIIDVRTTSNGEILTHKHVGEFEIVNTVNEVYK